MLKAAAGDKSKVPKGVDPHRLEHYLSDDDFQTVFGFSKQHYESMPKWKATKAKKSAGLF